MARVVKKGKRFVVVNSVNGVPVGRPNTFTTRRMALKRARQVRCRVKRIC